MIIFSNREKLLSPKIVSYKNIILFTIVLSTILVILISILFYLIIKIFNFKKIEQIKNVSSSLKIKNLNGNVFEQRKSIVNLKSINPEICTIDKLIEIQEEKIRYFDSLKNNFISEKQYKEDKKKYPHFFTSFESFFMNKYNLCQKYIDYIKKIIRLIVVKSYEEDISYSDLEIAMKKNKEKIKDFNIDGVSEDSMSNIDLVSLYILKTIEISKKLYDEDNLLEEIKEMLNYLLKIKTIIRQSDANLIKEKISKLYEDKPKDIKKKVA